MRNVKKPLCITQPRAGKTKYEEAQKLREHQLDEIIDDEWIRDFLRIFFEAESCHVVVIETTEEGLAELKYQAYDL